MASPEYDTRNTFVSRALERVTQLCGANKKYGLVKESCAYVLTYLKDGRTASASPATVMSVCFVPLRLAAESKSSKIIEISLDCMQKLMEYSFITGDMRWVPPSLPPDARWAVAFKQDAAADKDKDRDQLIHHVVSAICANSTSSNDGVQLQIIKALLTAVSTPGCGVHGTTLVMAVRNTYNIYLVSVNVTNQTTAKAALNHMINIVFTRMEASGGDGKQKQRPASLSTTPTKGALASPFAHKTPSSNSCAAAPKASPGASPLEKSVDSPADDDAQLAGETASTLHDEGEVESVLTDGEPAPAGGAGAPPGHEGSGRWLRNLVEVIVENAVNESDFDFDAALAERIATKQALRPEPCKNVQSLTRALASDGADADTEKMVFQNQLHKDAFLLFWNFSKLSDKSIPDTSQQESLEMKSKLLSLELLYNLIQKAGPTFRTSERFIQTVKKNLCLSLLQNCVTPNLPVFRMSLHIFLALIAGFKDHLKAEIGFFFTNVFFAILESPNSSYEQKMLVIHVIYKICETPQTIIDIFVNYDCDLESINIFEVMTNNLSRIIQTRHAAGAETPKQEQDMRVLALKALVIILQSIVSWTEKFAELQQQQQQQAEAPDGSETPGQNGNGHLTVDGGNQQDVATPTSVRSASHYQNANPEADSDSTDLGKAIAYKREVRELLELFLKSPGKGLAAFQLAGIVGKDAASVARFLREYPGLSKVSIGLYLGVFKEFNQAVLSDFVELFDFSSMEIDEALRRFMSAFKIHGEAQIIDATMEKFAECYTKANQNTFPNASTAYVLSFSILMLHTDAHSAQVKDKMSKDEFLRNNAGTDDGKDLPPKLLCDIYDRVTGKAFILENEELPGASAANASGRKGRKAGVIDAVFLSDSKKRQINYAEESKMMLQKTTELFKGNLDASKKKKACGAFLRASKMENVKPMFESCWAAMLPAFSVILEQSGNDQQASIDLCLDGFVRSIHIACMFYLDVERDAFVSALAKLTFLSNYREIEPKNIKSIKALIDIASREGTFLRSSWFAVLRCFSQLDKLQLLGSGAKPDFAFLNQPLPASGRRGHRPSFNEKASAQSQSSGGNSFNNSVTLPNRQLDSEKERIRHYEMMNSLIIADQIDEVAISRIYGSTIDLSDEAIVYFVKHLCEVSFEEIEQSHPPRMFSLQKLIEIADINMSRIRFVWGQLWQYMAKHFIRVGTNNSLSVSMFGIDSLRQLSTKFLEKRELTNYQFQRDFLKPFESIFQETRLIEIRELIVRCVSQIVHGKARHVKSGWKSIFAVFALAAGDTNEQIIVLAFDAVNHICENYFALVVVADAFVDAVNCMISFACNTLSQDIAKRSIVHLQECAESLVNGVHTDEGEESKYVVRPLAENDKIDSEDRVQLRVWFPVFTGLSTGATQHPDVVVRLASLNALFDILKQYGGRFTIGMWKIVLAGAVFPVFDNALCDLALAIEIQEENHPDISRNINVLEVGLTHLVRLFSMYFHPLRQLLGDVLNIILSCIKKPTPPAVAKHGIAALIDLIVNHSDLSLVEGGVAALVGPSTEPRSNPVPRDADETGKPRFLFGEPEWEVLRLKIKLIFDSKMLGKRNLADLTKHLHGSAQTAHGGAAVEASVPTIGVREDFPIPEPIALAHLTTLLTLLPTQARFIDHLGPQWSQVTLIDMLSCFEKVHAANGKVLKGEFKSGPVLEKAMVCEEKALVMHAECLLRKFNAYAGFKSEQACAHTTVVGELLYDVLAEMLVKTEPRFHSIIIFAVDALVALDDDEFSSSLSRFYPLVLQLILSQNVGVRTAAKRFFAKVGRLQLGIKLAVDVIAATSAEAPRP
ncbi:Brefeldin A-inhibited guanine nucleotide-exchange protein 3 [Diplonema papillatum]|nr:Brefeldin A-inhibited guanine nucleotide-exchange protein 3 [Diplonema papillatum]